MQESVVNTVVNNNRATAKPRTPHRSALGISSDSPHLQITPTPTSYNPIYNTQIQPLSSTEPNIQSYINQLKPKIQRQHAKIQHTTPNPARRPPLLPSTTRPSSNPKPTKRPELHKFPRPRRPTRSLGMDGRGTEYARGYTDGYGEGVLCWG